MFSKPLQKGDQSAFDFSKEMLKNDQTAGINIETIFYNPERGYCIFEYLLCDEKQFVTPHTSHPSKYWYKNKRKFLTLWKLTLDLNGSLYLVNYAKKGTKSENQVRIIRVLNMDEFGILDEETHEITRIEFSKWIRKVNSTFLNYRQ